MEASRILGKSADLLSDFSLREPSDETIVDINSGNIVVHATTILSDDSKPEIVYTFKAITEIQVGAGGFFLKFLS